MAGPAGNSRRDPPSAWSRRSSTGPSVIADRKAGSRCRPAPRTPGFPGRARADALARERAYPTFAGVAYALRESDQPEAPQGDELPSPYKRVLLKLSGEVFGGGKVGVDPDIVSALARQIARVVGDGVQVAVVVGGGNFFRGAELQQRGMDRDRADYMGMLGTVMNCLALQDFLEKEGTQTRVQTAITMGQIAEPYVPRRAERHLDKGRVVIFGAGSGMPYFSTDTVAAQRALEISAEVLLMGKQGVDGVYDADPHKDPSATKFADLSYDEYLARDLKVADATAVSMARDYKLPMIFFSLDHDGSVVQVVAGEKIGTTVHA